MSVVVDKNGKIWLQCEDPHCAASEHPEDLQSHQIFVDVPLKDVKSTVEAELERRRLGR